MARVRWMPLWIAAGLLTVVGVGGAVAFFVDSGESPSRDAAHQPETSARDPLPAGLSQSALDTVCKGPCPGPSSVQLWRDADDRLQRIVFRGDLMRCSHVTTIWHDAAGRKLLALDDRPVQNQAQGAENRRKIAAVLKDLTRAQSLSCPP